MLSFRSAVAAPFVMALLLSGCSSAASPGDVEPTATPTALAAFPAPDMRPWPESPPLGEDELERLRLESADAAWARVQALYPQAVRPELEFEKYLPEAQTEAWVQIQLDCLEQKGVPAAPGFTESGALGGFEINAEDEADAVGAYVCGESYRTKPRAQPSAEQISWVYDYLTEFLAPCYEHYGYEVPAPPDRQYFVENWPQQGWYPSPGIDSLDSPQWQELDEACPHFNR